MNTRTVLFLLLVISLLLTGCGSRATAGSGTVSLRIWYSTDDPVERTWSQQLARGFEATHRGIQVRLTPYSFEDLNTKLQLALSAGDPPDLAYVTPRGPGIPAYVGAHRLRDLTKAAQSHNWASRLQPGLLTAYNQPFAFYGAPPRRVVAVPTSLAAVGILYNRRLLERLHLSVPDSLGTFETALARAKAAGYTPIGLGNGDGWLGDDWYLTLVNALVPPASLTPVQRLSTGFSFRRPPFLEAARLLQQWANRGYFSHDFGGLDAQEGVDLFFRGKTLFQLVSSSENPQILQDQEQTRLPVGLFAFPTHYPGTFTYPVGRPRDAVWGHGGDAAPRSINRPGSAGRVMPLSGYEGWVVPAQSPHSHEAIAFIDYLLSPSVARFLVRQGVLPAHNTTRDALLQTGYPLGVVRTRSWQRDYLQSLVGAQPGVYLDAAPVANLNATMEANVQLLLQGYEAPEFLVKSLQEVYASRGNRGSSGRIDGEF